MVGQPEIAIQYSKLTGTSESLSSPLLLRIQIYCLMHNFVCHSKVFCVCNFVYWHLVVGGVYSLNGILGSGHGARKGPNSS